MKRAVALVLLVASMAAQANALPCPMAGRAAPGGHAVTGAPAVVGGSHHGPASAPATHPGGDDAPPPAPGGCGVLMACGLAAATAAPSAPALPLPTPLVQLARRSAPLSAASPPVELPPPRA